MAPTTMERASSRCEVSETAKDGGLTFYLFEMPVNETKGLSRRLFR